MIFNIPIESLEERYSAQWNKWFPQEFKKFGLEYTTIYPEPMRKYIKDGQFLDIIGTNYFKACQLQEICRAFDDGRVQDGDVFFFHDLWFPGIEMLFYIRNALGIKFKITGLLHAGSYDPSDFLALKGMNKWGAFLETSWFNEIDAIFVATKYHKELLMRTRALKGNNIIVNSFPIYWEDKYKDIQKENIVVFPHRLSSDKQPELFDKLSVTLKQYYPNWKCVRTKDLQLNKDEYYWLLAKSKIVVSCALHENWGIAMQESFFSGCIPIMPFRLSYIEMYNKNFFYSQDELIFGSVSWAIKEYDNIIKSKEFSSNRKELIQKGKKAIENMIMELLR